jgi:hypothetical protein
VYLSYQFWTSTLERIHFQIKVGEVDNWIDIQEFSQKYGVSSTTLRRRIRSKSIPYKLNKGRYLLEDSEKTLSGAPLFSRHHQSAPPQGAESGGTKGIFDPIEMFLENGDVLPIVMKSEFEQLKKENRRLKQEIAELQTLVKVLEGELASL